MDRQAFLEEVKLWAAATGRAKDLHDGLVEAWYRELKHFPFPAFQSVLRDLIRTNMRYPEVRDFIRGMKAIQREEAKDEHCKMCGDIGLIPVFNPLTGNKGCFRCSCPKGTARSSRSGSIYGCQSDHVLELTSREYMDAAMEAESVYYGRRKGAL